jgi:hypothetical protein
MEFDILLIILRSLSPLLLLFQPQLAYFQRLLTYNIDHKFLLYLKNNDSLACNLVQFFSFSNVKKTTRLAYKSKALISMSFGISADIHNK